MHCWASFVPAVACCSRLQRVTVGTQQLSPSSSPLNSSSPLLSHAATHRASEKDSYNTCMLEDGPVRAACVVTIAVEGDPFKQEYSQLLGGSSQGSKFIILGHSAQLTSWNTLQSLSWNDRSHLHYWKAWSINQAANTKFVWLVGWFLI